MMNKKDGNHFNREQSPHKEGTCGRVNTLLKLYAVKPVCCLPTIGAHIHLYPNAAAEDGRGLRLGRLDLAKYAFPLRPRTSRVNGRHVQVFCIGAPPSCVHIIA